MSAHQADTTVQDERLARNDEVWARIGVCLIAAAVVVELARAAVSYLW